MQGVARHFTPADLERIQNAVSQAEQTTSAEIVPCIVDRSDGYEEAIWRVGVLSGSLSLAFLGILNAVSEVWLPVRLTEVVLIVLLFTAASMLATLLIPPFRRFAAGKELIDLRVGQKAKEVFLSGQIFGTRDRTGILLFISLLEHRVIILADSGISSVVEEAVWDDVIAPTLAGLRSGKGVDGVTESIARLARLLEDKGFSRRPDDRNELPDRPRSGREA